MNITNDLLDKLIKENHLYYNDDSKCLLPTSLTTNNHSNSIFINHKNYHYHDFFKNGMLFYQFPDYINKKDWSNKYKIFHIMKIMKEKYNFSKNIKIIYLDNISSKLYNGIFKDIKNIDNKWYIILSLIK
tara:strand:- start:196 stop:585 length:390 start_codon:yes stop_codon:yes gene_type:complete